MKYHKLPFLLKFVFWIGYIIDIPVVIIKVVIFGYVQPEWHSNWLKMANTKLIVPYMIKQRYNKKANQ